MNETAPPPRLSLTREIRRSLEGAARLLMFDAGALRYFNMSVAGFWRSFLAALIAAPIIALILMFQDGLLRANAGSETEIPPLSQQFASEIFAYPLSVALFPVAMIGLSRLLKVTHRYVPDIIAYNWASVIASLLTLAPLLVYAAGLIDARHGLAAVLGLKLVICGYLWFIARASLGVPGLTAAGLVLIDVLLSVLMDGLIDLASG